MVLMAVCLTMVGCKPRAESGVRDAGSAGKGAESQGTNKQKVVAAFYLRNNNGKPMLCLADCKTEDQFDMANVVQVRSRCIFNRRGIALDAIGESTEQEIRQLQAVARLDELYEKYGSDTGKSSKGFIIPSVDIEAAAGPVVENAIRAFCKNAKYDMKDKTDCGGGAAGFNPNLPENQFKGQAVCDSPKITMGRSSVAGH
jgi:hypothetical protein